MIALRGQALVGLCAGGHRLVGDGRRRRSSSPSARRRAAANCPPRVIAPDDLGQETRGKGTNTRYVTNILPESEPAERLLVVEVITPAGHTSSYPPHKHDEDNCPASLPSRRPTITGSTRRRALPSSASTPMTARSTRRWRSRTAT